MTVPKGKPNDTHPDVIARQLGLSRMGNHKALSRDALLTLAVNRYWDIRLGRVAS